MKSNNWKLNLSCSGSFNLLGFFHTASPIFSTFAALMRSRGRHFDARGLTLDFLPFSFSRVWSPPPLSPPSGRRRENICDRTKGTPRVLRKPLPPPTEFTDGAALQSSAGREQSDKGAGSHSSSVIHESYKGMR